MSVSSHTITDAFNLLVPSILSIILYRHFCFFSCFLSSFITFSFIFFISILNFLSSFTSSYRHHSFLLLLNFFIIDYFPSAFAIITVAIITSFFRVLFSHITSFYRFSSHSQDLLTLFHLCNNHRIHPFIIWCFLNDIAIEVFILITGNKT
ncbi:unnamed protein product [Acanthosepion pharaonis]|uniref:Uncharacterized protein n=1 Tax=Acanthosepion pharaonis TaxID=158019 RepID=A0A812CB63_ACAPH|nr:unnamed protein product [Sepia pharaonis]